MARLIRSISRGNRPTYYWHLVGDNPKQTQWMFKWNTYINSIQTEEMTDYGSDLQGINHYTGENWGTPATWEKREEIRISLDLSSTVKDQIEAVEKAILGYIDTALFIQVDKILP